MAEKNTIAASDILYFRSLISDNHSRLKIFIHFMKSYGLGPGHLKFAYLDSSAPLINGLTIRENIYLDSLPLSLSDSKEMRLATHLKRTQNEALLELFERIPRLDVYPHQVDPQTRKIAALIKVMLQDTQYILLEEPENYLEPEVLDLFTSAMKFQVQSLSQVALVYSKHDSLWTKNCTKFIDRNEDRSFCIVPNDQVTFDKSFVKNSTKKSA